jgi:hypothetical protein
MDIKRNSWGELSAGLYITGILKNGMFNVGNDACHPDGSEVGIKHYS